MTNIRVHRKGTTRGAAQAVLGGAAAALLATVAVGCSRDAGGSAQSLGVQKRFTPQQLNCGAAILGLPPVAKDSDSWTSKYPCAPQRSRAGSESSGRSLQLTDPLASFGAGALSGLTVKDVGSLAGNEAAGPAPGGQQAGTSEQPAVSSNDTAGSPPVPKEKTEDSTEPSASKGPSASEGDAPTPTTPAAQSATGANDSGEAGQLFQQVHNMSKGAAAEAAQGQAAGQAAEKNSHAQLASVCAMVPNAGCTDAQKRESRVKLSAALSSKDPKTLWSLELANLPYIEASGKVAIPTDMGESVLSKYCRGAMASKSSYCTGRGGGAEASRGAKPPSASSGPAEPASPGASSGTGEGPLAPE